MWALPFLIFIFLTFAPLADRQNRAWFWNSIRSWYSWHYLYWQCRYLGWNRQESVDSRHCGKKKKIDLNFKFWYRFNRHSKQKYQTGKVKTQHNVPTSTLVQVNNEIWVNSFEKPELHFFDVKNYSQLGSAPFQSDSPIFDLETVDNTVWGGTLTGSILIFDGTVSSFHCKFLSISTSPLFFLPIL